eukprot:2473983-Rhodomonas_salina.1
MAVWNCSGERCKTSWPRKTPASGPRKASRGHEGLTRMLRRASRSVGAVHLVAGAIRADASMASALIRWIDVLAVKYAWETIDA